MGRRRELGRAGSFFAAPATWLGVAVVAACLANGAGSYLRRTGLIETAKYEAFWNVHTGPGGWKSSPFGLGRRCDRHAPLVRRAPDAESPSAWVFATEPWEVPGKLLKELVPVALVAGSLLAWARGRSRPVPLARSWPSVALAALVAWKVAAGLAGDAPWMAAAGLRAFAFLGIAVLAGWVTSELLSRLVPWLVGILAVQALLAPLELLRGVTVHGHGYLFGEYFARRATGTFAMPNTLGVFAVGVVALAMGYGASARVRWLAWGLGTLVVFLAGSATGIVLLVALGVWEALRDLRGAGRVAVAVAGGALLAGVLAFLPSLMHRWDVYESARARTDALAQSVRGPAPAVLFGRGIGLGTNASFQLRAKVGAGAEFPALPGGDSAVVALVLQTGLVGLALFALSLAIGALRNPSARPLFFVLALASLTLSLSEAFPLNLLLGLLLAQGGGSPRGSGLPSTLYWQ